MKKILLSLTLAAVLLLSSCNFDLTGGWNTSNDNVTLTDLIETELLAEKDADTAIEEDVTIEIPANFSKFAPGPNDPRHERRRVNLKLKHEIDSVDVQHSIEYFSDDTALVTLTKTVIGSMLIRNTDTSITDTPVVWDKPFEYTTTSYMRFIRFAANDSSALDSTVNDSSGWRLYAKSIEAGATSGIMNSIVSVTLASDANDSDMVFDDPEKLYDVVRGYVYGGLRGHFRGRPGSQQTEVYATIDGSDDVNVLGSSGRYFALLDDGQGIDLTADDHVFSGTVMHGRGQSRLRVRMVTTATFIEEDAPVEIATWFLPVR